MNKEEIRQALVKFDREDLLFGNNDIYLDDNVEVFLTISQMIKFNNQQKVIDQLTNNLNELEEYIIEQEEINNGAMKCGLSSDSEINEMGIQNDIYDLILDKMNEIKEGNNVSSRN